MMSLAIQVKLELQKHRTNCFNVNRGINGKQQELTARPTAFPGTQDK